MNPSRLVPMNTEASMKNLHQKLVRKSYGPALPLSSNKNTGFSRRKGCLRPLIFRVFPQHSIGDSLCQRRAISPRNLFKIENAGDRQIPGRNKVDDAGYLRSSAAMK